MPDTWEVKDNVAENVLRDYEDRWWTACREVRFKQLRLTVSQSALELADTAHRQADEIYIGSRHGGSRGFARL